MKKKYYMIGISCIILLIAGICYSCSFRADSADGTLIRELSGNKQQQDGLITVPASVSQDINVDRTEMMNQNTVDLLLPANGSTSAKPDNSSASDAEQSENDMIYVHLCGMVRKPGVYQVTVGARVIDVIDLAGGLMEEAAGDYVNQAQQVQDGQRIYIPSLDEVKELPLDTYSAVNPAGQTDTVSSNRLININTADKQELMELPGIGDAKAADIIEYRTTNGSFENVEELMKIPGIKEGLFHKVSSLITVN
jgi:competence protein ComEA